MTISPATIARYQRIARIMRPAATLAEYHERHHLERHRIGTVVPPVVRYQPVPEVPARAIGRVRSCA